MSEKKRVGSDPKGWIETTFEVESVEYLFGKTDQIFEEDVICGVGKVDGKSVAFYAQNPKVDRGFISSQGADKIIHLMDEALKRRLPIVAFLFSAGVSITEGITSGQAYAKIISRNIALSGVVPQFAVIIGSTMGAPAYSATLMDLVIFNKVRSYLMVTSPAVLKMAIGETTTLQDLGGSELHSTVTGIADFVEPTIEAQLQRLQELIALLPSDNASLAEKSKVIDPDEAAPRVPERNVAWNMEKVLVGFVDGSKYHLYRPAFGKSILCAFARINGQSVGIVANQSTTNAGSIDCDASIKATRFIRLCDAFNLPIITLIDVPGFMPGTREEQKGLLRHGASFCSAMDTSVPRISIVIRRCYGAAAFLMLQNGSTGQDLVLALPQSKIAIMGYAAAKALIYPDDPRSEEDKMTDYFDNYESPQVALRNGLIDKIVDVHELRPTVMAHLSKVHQVFRPVRYDRKHPILP